MPVPALRALLPVVGKLLLRIPFREVLFFVVLLVIAGENYPFSNFPMYSSLDDESFYFVVKTGQGETLPFATSFRSRASYVPKALKTERRKLEKEGLSSEAALNQAGHNVLNHLLEKAEPQSRDELVRSGLKLVEVRIWVANARLEQSENTRGRDAAQMKFDSQVVRHASWEMALMRAAFALMVWSSVPFFYYQTTLSHPSGLAHFVNLGFLINPEILGILRGLLAVALLFYVTGLFTFSSLSVVTFLLAACGSLENSQGAINRTFQPLGLAALAQWAVSGYWAVRRRLQRGVPFFPLASAGYPAAAHARRESRSGFLLCNFRRHKVGTERRAVDPKDSQSRHRHCEDQRQVVFKRFRTYQPPGRNSPAIHRHPSAAHADFLRIRLRARILFVSGAIGTLAGGPDRWRLDRNASHHFPGDGIALRDFRATGLHIPGKLPLAGRPHDRKNLASGAPAPLGRGLLSFFKRERQHGIDFALNSGQTLQGEPRVGEDEGLPALDVLVDEQPGMARFDWSQDFPSFEH